VISDTAPWSRSDRESSIYMFIHPCGCGSVDFDPEREAREVGGVWHTYYTGECRNCGARRQFVFRISAEIPQLAPGAWSTGTEPSQLIDPGEWLSIADDLGATADDDVLELDEEQQCYRRVDLGLAAGAIDEVMLSLPPGADMVPAAACRSDLGRRVYLADPSRFRRDQLELARDVYASLAGEVQPHDWDVWPLRARSINEASLFTELHRCGCGQIDFDRKAHWVPAPPDETRATLTYSGDCARCGSARYFSFSVPADADSSRAPDPLGAGYSYPGDGPSEVLDPAQFWLYANHCAGAADQLLAEAPAGLWSDDDNWDGITELLAVSVAAMREVLAFIPPGADRVPAAAFSSATGRVLHRTNPEIFLRDRLAEVHAERDRLLQAFLAEHPSPDDEE
jgi:hypothetical protein